ncbi:hypothetical protein [Clostridium coskatii]|nr:hypothetical protein [Clostridium coskatii]
MGKIVKVAVSVAVAASIVVPNFVKADNYGFNGNWNIYKTQNVMFAKILNSTVPDNPSAPNNLNKHNVQAQMDKYNSNISKYTVVNSITNGATVGEDPVETGDVKFKYSLETLNDSNNTVAGWYSSTYGPLLDYGTPNYTNLDKQAEDFLRFDKLLFPQGNDRVYVTQGRINYMRDAKTIATLYNAKYPIVLDQGSTSVAESANELNAKKLIFLGGTGNAGCNAIFSSMEGVGDNGYDMVRIGGINSEQTARFLKQLPESVYDSPDQPEDGVTVDSSVSSSLVNGLTDTLKKQGFTAAVK